MNSGAIDFWWNWDYVPCPGAAMSLGAHCYKLSRLSQCLGWRDCKPKHLFEACSE